MATAWWSRRLSPVTTPDALPHLEGQLDRLPPGQRLRILGHVGAEPGEIDLLLGKQQAARVALGEIEHIVDQRAEPADALQDRGDIVARGSRQVARIALRHHLGEAGDRGQRRAQLVAHVGDEGGLEPVGLLQRLVAVAQRRLDLPAVGNVEHGEERIAVRQRHRGEFELAPVLHRDPARALLALDRGAAHQLADQTGMAGALELRRQQRGQRIDPGMGGKLLLLQAPQLAEAVVPEVEPPVRGEDADRLEQIVEGGGAHAQQRVAGRGELDLLGPVLEDDQQAAVGQRLGDDAQMLAAGQQPILLVRGEPGGEPGAMLLLPIGKVAHLGQIAGLAHRVDHPVELGPVGEEIGGQREQPRERLVEEDQAPVAAELGDAGRQPVEHVALGADEAGEIGMGLLLVLDVDRIAGDAAGAERHLDHLHHPPLAGDGGGDGAARGLLRLAAPRPHRAAGCGHRLRRSARSRAARPKPHRRPRPPRHRRR